ncbi:glycine hydroxymethyltransferase [Vigna unguiculata]|uniref:Glycine hydroxymethyltransferase n=1 Tax=Vigna unguiculata TaxID=3917 RepID=A0A4D6NS81_VIGUN|nr:glycine hydroxymethyltransferase [Vigna unguiculata]
MEPGLSLGLSASSTAAPLSDTSVPWRFRHLKEEEEEDENNGETINFMDQRVKRKIEGHQQPCFPSKRVAMDSSVGWWNQPLEVADPEIFDIMEKEKGRQFKGIELIASENFVCRAVMEALGSHLSNKYSEGMPGAKYYTGNQYIDEIELLCCQRALSAFDLHPNNWGVNVQPYSCTSANFAVYTGILHPGDRIMGMDSASGGHLSHGYYTQGGKKVSAASIFFETLPYKVNPQSGYIDYDKLEEKAMDFRPKILICGALTLCSLLNLIQVHPPSLLYLSFFLLFILSSHTHNFHLSHSLSQMRSLSTPTLFLSFPCFFASPVPLFPCSCSCSCHTNP